MKKIKSLSVLFATVGFVGLLNGCAGIDTSQSDNSSESIEGQPVETVDSQTVEETPVDPLAEFDKEVTEKWTNTAKILAGIKVDENSKFSEIQATNSWQNHRNFLENSWSQLESQQLSKVRKWSSEHLKAINDTSPSVFYPFSGPDFLYAYSLFPQGKEYVLIGLEPVGTVPDFDQLSPAQSAQKIQEAKNSLFAILKYSFFRTNDMKVDMARQGVLPILFLFMGRTNQTILDVEYVGVAKDATVQKYQEGMVPGVKISFVPEGESTPRTLYYFSTDLSNGGLEKNPEFKTYMQQIKQPVTYLKAASYLMHYGTFSTMRNLVLSQSDNLLQDDSGIPVKSFNTEQWNLTFYGNYTPPRAPFNQQEYQPDLMTIYRSNKNIDKLNFGIGYNFGPNESNLMLANPK
ncbi:MAG: hypothetical protein QNJ33_01625 [Crocosphaera sp.]|nr:hypothetical protein [Crocosphaera sp.]